MTETTRLTVSDDWDASARITATAETAVAVRNTDGSRIMFYAITPDDTAPDFDAHLGLKILPGMYDKSEIDLILKSGDRLWLATSSGSFDVTVMQGDA